MNERIKELAEQAGIGPWGITIDKSTEIFQKFAELIVKECIEIAQDRANFPGFPPNDVNDIIDEIREHFGVEECRGWVCPKCGVDRTKDVCPQGHMAAVEGKCPMIGVAQ